MFLEKYLPAAQNQPPQAHITNMSRRGFVGVAGTFVLGVSLAACSAKTEAPAQITNSDNGITPSVAGVETAESGPLLFIGIAPDNQVTLTVHRSEMGQQAWTAVTQILADELDVDLDKVIIKQAIGHPKYGNQNTDGSTTIRNGFDSMRQTGASMRAMLIEAAAQQWDVKPSSLATNMGYVINGNERLSYGELAQAASALSVPDAKTVALKPRKDWRYIGKPVPSKTVPRIIRGDSTYGIDVKRPDMVYAVIAHPPVLFTKPKSIDNTAAMAVPGVLKTFEMPAASAPAGFGPLGGVAVIATDTWAAIQGREALKVDWSEGENADYDSEEFKQALLETVRNKGESRRNRGDVYAALDAADKTISAEYYAPHLAQAPMEPPAATAEWTGDTVEIWACTQAPQGMRRMVATACGIPEDDVTINVTWLGGGFGRKSKPDFGVEAALIARDIGKPVKVTWTREDDLKHGYAHSVSAQRLEAALDENGSPLAFLHRTAFPPIGSTFGAGNERPGDGEMEMGAVDNPFNIPNIRIESGNAPAKIRIGWLRSVANVYHAFAVQSFAAEMAHAAGEDQKDYLLKLIGVPRIEEPAKDGAVISNYGKPLDDYPLDTARLAHVTREAAKLAGWGRDLPKGHGLGIATHRSFLSYVSTVVEVKVDEQGNITIPGIWSAIDAGTVVNPRHVTAQIEGGTIFGISNAMFGQLTAKNGQVQQANFPDWRVMRMLESPRAMQVKIIDSDAPPGGVGEPGTPPAAPALANAIFAATGQRIRELPILGMNDQLAI